MEKMFFNVLATFAESESDSIRLRTGEGVAIAKAKAKLRDRQSKLCDTPQKELQRMYETGQFPMSDLGKLFSVFRSTVCRTPARRNESK